MTRKECKFILMQSVRLWTELADAAGEEYQKLVGLKATSQRTLRFLKSMEARGVRMAAQHQAEVDKLEREERSKNSLKRDVIGTRLSSVQVSSKASGVEPGDSTKAG